MPAGTAATTSGSASSAPSVSLAAAVRAHIDAVGAVGHGERRVLAGHALDN